MRMDNLLNITSCVMYGNDYFLYLDGDNCIYRINRDDRVMEEFYVPKDNNCDICEGFGISINGDNVFTIPAHGKQIRRICLTTKKEELFDVPKARKEAILKNSNMDFFNAVSHHQNTYFFGYAYPGIVKMNHMTGEMSIIDEWVDGCRKNFNNSYAGCFHKSYSKLGDEIYYPFMNMNAVLHFDMNDGCAEVIYVGDKSQRYISIEFDGRCFWLIPRDPKTGSVVKWDPKEDREYYYNDYPKGIVLDERTFFRSMFHNDRVYMFANGGNMNVSIDVTTGQMESFPELYDTGDIIYACKYPIVSLERDEVFIMACEQWIQWDLITNDIKRTTYKISDKIMEHLREVFNNRVFGGIDCFLEENRAIQLNDYLYYVKS